MMLRITSVIILTFLLGSGVTAQTHLSYTDSLGQYLPLSTTYSLGHGTDTGGIEGFAQRFDLPPGNHVLDSVDFVIDSVGTDSLVLDIVPVMSVNTTSGVKLLPDFRPGGVRRVYFENKIASGARTAINCSGITVSNSFFVFIGSSGGNSKFRALGRNVDVTLDTARAAYTFFSTHGPFPDVGVPTDLVDENLVGKGVDVNLCYGITYENVAGVTDESQRRVVALGFPNPVKLDDVLRVVKSNRAFSAEIRDQAGRLVREERLNPNLEVAEISTQGLAPGVYCLLLRALDGNASVLRFVIK